MKSTGVDESLSSMNQQFCSRENQLLQISIMYLGKIENRRNQEKLKAEELFPISENGYTLGRLLDGTKCQLLLDTGVNKSFMSKSFHM